MGNTSVTLHEQHRAYCSESLRPPIQDAQLISNDDAMSSNSRTKSRMTYVRATFEVMT